MPEEAKKSEEDIPLIYEIRISGHLSDEWKDWFDGMAVSLQEDGDTILTGPVVDQSALYGLLKKLRNLGLPLVSVNRINE